MAGLLTAVAAVVAAAGASPAGEERLVVELWGRERDQLVLAFGSSSGQRLTKVRVRTRARGEVLVDLVATRGTAEDLRFACVRVRTDVRPRRVLGPAYRRGRRRLVPRAPAGTPQRARLDRRCRAAPVVAPDVAIDVALPGG
jgi:hypothetical protein